MLLRALESGRPESVELMSAMRRTFETIAMAKVSTSAADARHIGMLLATDRITMNRERLLTDAKRSARELADGGYSAPIPRVDIPAAGENILALRPHDAAGRIHQRSRRQGGQLSGPRPVRRAG